MNVGFSFSAFQNNNINWMALDRIPDPRIKVAFLGQLFPAVESELFPDMATVIDYSFNFNIIDFSGDRLLDMIYHGPNTALDSSEVLRLYLNDKNNAYTFFKEFPGKAIKLDFTNARLTYLWMQTSSMTSKIDYLTKYEVDTTEIDLNYLAKYEIVVSEGTEFPKDFSDSLIIIGKGNSYSVERNGFYIRHNPRKAFLKIDSTKTDSTLDILVKPKENILMKLSKGMVVYPLSTENDSLDQMWQFVLLKEEREYRQDSLMSLFIDNDENLEDSCNLVDSSNNIDVFNNEEVNGDIDIADSSIESQEGTLDTLENVLLTNSEIETQEKSEVKSQEEFFEDFKEVSTLDSDFPTPTPAPVPIPVAIVVDSQNNGDNLDDDWGVSESENDSDLSWIDVEKSIASGMALVPNLSSSSDSTLIIASKSDLTLDSNLVSKDISSQVVSNCQRQIVKKTIPKYYIGWININSLLAK